MQIPYNISDNVYNIIGLSLLSMVSGLRTFGRDRYIFYRESASGMNRVSYFVAKVQQVPAMEQT